MDVLSASILAAAALLAGALVALPRLLRTPVRTPEGPQSPGYTADDFYALRAQVAAVEQELGTLKQTVELRHRKVTGMIAQARAAGDVDVAPDQGVVEQIEANLAGDAGATRPPQPNARPRLVRRR